MVDSLQCNYEQIEAIANKCTQQSELIDGVVQKMRQHLLRVEGEWIGLGHAAFFDKMENDVLPASRKLHEAFLDASTMTRQIAEAIRDAEQEAAGAFQVIA